MTTNLIFKRQVTTENGYSVETRIVPVDIPHIASGEGWTLSGHTDTVEVFTDVVDEINPTPIVDETTQRFCEELAKLPDTAPSIKGATDSSKKFISNVPGTAKLVRGRGLIRIVARRGKSTYNQTTPNSVCIDDYTKNEFFKNCREVHGNIGQYSFYISDGDVYDYWNNIIDKEYNRQREEYLKMKEN